MLYPRIFKSRYPLLKGKDWVRTIEPDDRKVFVELGMKHSEYGRLGAKFVQQLVNVIIVVDSQKEKMMMIKKWRVWNATWSHKLIWQGTEQDAQVWRRANLLVEEIT